MDKALKLLTRPAVILSGALIILVSYLMIAGAVRTSPKEPNRIACFEEHPIVIVCSSSQYSEIEIDNSLSYWEDLGYEFFDVVYGFNCNSNTTGSNSIVIDAAGPSFDDGNNRSFHRFGKTTITYMKQTEEILSARIEILVSQERVLEHEIGHALGWGHADIPGHIMHPLISNGGWDSSGLESEPKEQLLKK